MGYIAKISDILSLASFSQPLLVTIFDFTTFFILALMMATHVHFYSLAVTHSIKGCNYNYWMPDLEVAQHQVVKFLYWYTYACMTYLRLWMYTYTSWAGCSRFFTREITFQSAAARWLLVTVRVSTTDTCSLTAIPVQKRLIMDGAC